MGRNSLAATLYLALVFGSVICSAHNTFSMSGRNRWKAGGKRSEPAAEHPQQNFLDTDNYNEEQHGENTITLREMLVDLRDYCDFLLKLLDGVRPVQTETK